MCVCVCVCVCVSRQPLDHEPYLMRAGGGRGASLRHMSTPQDARPALLRWVPRRQFAAHERRRVSPRSLHVRGRPSASCRTAASDQQEQGSRGCAGAAAGDIEGGAAIQSSWRAAAVVVPAPRSVGFGAQASRPGSASGDLTLGARAWLFAACRRGGLPPSSARGCAPRWLFLLTVSSLRRGVPGRRSSLLPVHRDGVVAMNSG